MNKKLFFLFFILTLLSFYLNPLSWTFAEEQDKDIDYVKSLMNTSGDFNLKVEVEGEEVAGNPITVDGITTFRILRTDEADKNNLYKLYYFLEGRFSRMIDEVLLPYEFKQTYRGLLAGSYEIIFVLKDGSGNYGSSKFSIKVRH